eukprot:4946645-Amphidinium_carterae.1
MDVDVCYCNADCQSDANWFKACRHCKGCGVRCWTHWRTLQMLYGVCTTGRQFQGQSTPIGEREDRQCHATGGKLPQLTVVPVSPSAINPLQVRTVLQQVLCILTSTRTLLNQNEQGNKTAVWCQYREDVTYSMLCKGAIFKSQQGSRRSLPNDIGLVLGHLGYLCGVSDEKPRSPPCYLIQSQRLVDHSGMDTVMYQGAQQRGTFSCAGVAPLTQPKALCQRLPCAEMACGPFHMWPLAQGVPSLRVALCSCN